MHTVLLLYPKPHPTKKHSGPEGKIILVVHQTAKTPAQLQTPFSIKPIKSGSSGFPDKRCQHFLNIVQNDGGLFSLLFPRRDKLIVTVLMSWDHMYFKFTSLLAMFPWEVSTDYPFADPQ